ncbi:MAG: alcohol dehydrogenase catalytic domain-containing protein [Paenibacillaceae bacterium]
MKTLVWAGPEKMVNEDRDPVQLGIDEVLIRVESVGVCGSEIEGYLGHNSLRIPPLVMGHEFCGIVANIGEGVIGLEKGLKVTVNPLISCGTCLRCRQGKENLCDKRAIVGIHRPGAFAEYVSVPANSVRVVPSSMNASRAALTEPLACAWRATRRAMSDNNYANVVVFGAGAIGLLSAFSAQILGARKVIIVDLNDARLENAKAAGIEYTVNSGKNDMKKRLRDIADGAGIDVVIDAAGFQTTRSSSLEILNAGGTFMNIGLGIDETILRINHTIRSEINILGSFCYCQQDFSDALHLLTDGRITEEGWSEVRPMSEGQKAFEDLVLGKVSKGKIFLDPNI